MNFYTSNTTSFAPTNITAAPTFHATSSTKRGCEAVNQDDASFTLQDQQRGHKRIKISSSSESTGFFGGSSYQPSFQVTPNQFPIPSGSPCFAYDSGESSQTTKKRRAC